MSAETTFGSERKLLKFTCEKPVILYLNLLWVTAIGFALGQPLKWEFCQTECMPAGCTPVCPQVRLCLSVPLKTLEEMWCSAVQSSLSTMSWICNWCIYEILNKPLVSPSRLTTSLQPVLCGNVIGSGLLRAKKPKGELTGDRVSKSPRSSE